MKTKTYKHSAEQREYWRKQKISQGMRKKWAERKLFYSYDTLKRKGVVKEMRFIVKVEISPE